MKKLISISLTIIIALTSLLALQSSALASITIPDPPTSAGGLNVTYLQDDARAMLNRINSFRTGSEAWYWNPDNQSKTTLKNLKTYVYDYNLEQIAMIRAAEISESFSHTRPDGKTKVSNLMSDCGISWTSVGENIAYGYFTNGDAFKAWKEDNEKYSGQGHRRNMLSPTHNAIGIAHAVIGGTDYWVQVFAYIANPQTTPVVKQTVSSTPSAPATTTKASSEKKPSVSKGKISKITKKSKGFSVKFAKKSGEVGYQIQYSTSKNFKSNKKTISKKYKNTKSGSSTFSVSGLKKKKTYYVRVRAYKTYKSNGKTKTVYGSWSATKSVKTK